ncbi:tripartite tricarboxylate transporter TctB family protein [Jiella sonneratiae]|uniref:Tripartite tricarboxylate transporter TctB family protein n=1 Tax=Jiella sonneratiae TaxID=2816856 RepID=A0ABS3J7V9_9HYPH|nr:tripartite tricarboxylate transporter TctB family protein [Jiella sonneratiae]MBO0905197.1 tripartite tricarboxylate transporter TctB family protein [Jiella sonneratiae]
MAHRAEAHRSFMPHDPAGTGVAVLFVVLGAFLIAQTGGMTPMGSVFPITISAAMIVFSAILILRNVVIGLKSRAAPGEAEEAVRGEGGSIVRRILFLLMMAAWVGLIPVLGFFVASLLAFLAITAVAIHERVSAKEVAALAVIGLVILTAFYLLMANVLLIPMPRGLFF